MNRYQLLKDNEDTIFQFVKSGIMSYQIIRDIEIYERYLELDEYSNQMKYILLSEEFELGVKRIEQIIYQMMKQVN